MSHVIKDGDRLVLALGERIAGEEPRGLDFQLLSPLLLGLLAPFIVAAYFDPESLRHLRLPIWLFLLTMFVACTVLFFYNVHFPGRIHSIAVHRDSRMVEIEWRNLLSISTQLVPFDDIASLRVHYLHGADGSTVPIAELALRSRAPMILPAGTNEEHLRPLRAAIGLG